jgi:hypothetical protein
VRNFQLRCLALISSVFLCAGVAQSQAVPDTVGAATSGYSFSVLHSFCQSGFPCTDGIDPSSTLVRDAFAYGAGGGTVFKVDSTGHETVLYSFCSTLDCKDGNLPGALVRDAAGNLYGITSLGGTNNSRPKVWRHCVQVGRCRPADAPPQLLLLSAKLCGRDWPRKSNPRHCG